MVFFEHKTASKKFWKHSNGTKLTLGLHILLAKVPKLIVGCFVGGNLFF